MSIPGAGSVRLNVLGPFVLGGFDPPSTATIPAKARALLGYLAVECGRSHERGVVCGLLWSESPEAQARLSLRQTLFLLRRALGPPQADTLLEVTPAGLSLRPEVAECVDVQLFRRLLNAARTHRHRDPLGCTACRGWLEAALRLYRGALLEDLPETGSEPYDSWLTIERERLLRDAAEAASRLGACFEAELEAASLLQTARRHLELDPLSEEAHRRMLLALAWTGSRAAALRHYEGYARRLQEELGAEPPGALRMLRRRIASNAVSRITRPGRETRGVVNGDQAAATSFLGRDVELDRLGALIEDPGARLITIVGEGGVGKSRLAAEAGAAFARRFEHGAWWVPAASAADLDSLVHAIARSLGLSGLSGPSARRLLVDYLRSRRLLLILDNLEHLADAAELVLELLEGAHDLNVLATSRQRLLCQAECVVTLAGLALPDRDEAPAVEASPAVQLFLERARRLQPSQLDPDRDRGAIVRICRFLEGSPLGIELAAALTGEERCADIADQITRDPDRLASPFRDLIPGHRSLRAVFDHSWMLLSPAQREVLARLAPFVDGFTIDAAGQVAAASPVDLEALQQRSLIHPSAPGRYLLHEVVRRYAWERLEASGWLEQTRGLFVRYFASFAREGVRRATEEDHRDGMDRLAVEMANIRQAVFSAIDSGDFESAVATLGSFQHTFGARGSHGEAVAFFSTVVEHLRAGRRAPEDPGWCKALGVALESLGFYANRTNQHGIAVRCLREALSLHRGSGDLLRIAATHVYLADAVVWVRPVEATERLQEALEHFKTLRLPAAEMGARLGLANVALHEGRYPDACAECERVLATARELEHRYLECDALKGLGLTYLRAKRRRDAARYASAALALARASRNGSALVDALSLSGMVALARRQFDRAETLAREALEVATAISMASSVAGVLDVLACVALARGQSLEAMAWIERGLLAWTDECLDNRVMDLMLTGATLLRGGGRSEAADAIVIGVRQHLLAGAWLRERADRNAEEAPPPGSIRLDEAASVGLEVLLLSTAGRLDAQAARLRAEFELR